MKKVDEYIIKSNNTSSSLSLFNDDIIFRYKLVKDIHEKNTKSQITIKETKLLTDVSNTQNLSMYYITSSNTSQPEYNYIILNHDNFDEIIFYSPNINMEEVEIKNVNNNYLNVRIKYSEYFFNVNYYNVENIVSSFKNDFLVIKLFKFENN